MPKIIKWPEWLLQPLSARQENSDSPAASFKPVGAAAGAQHAFVAMTSPASPRVKRALVIDWMSLHKALVNSYKYERMAFLNMLTDYGLDLYLCCRDSHGRKYFIKADSASPCLLSNIEQLQEFVPATDFERLAEEFGVAFDQLIYLDERKCFEFIEGVFEKVAGKVVVERHEDTIKSLDELADIVSYADPADALQILKANCSLFNDYDDLMFVLSRIDIEDENSVWPDLDSLFTLSEEAIADNDRALGAEFLASMAADMNVTAPNDDVQAAVGAVNRRESFGKDYCFTPTAQKSPRMFRKYVEVTDCTLKIYNEDFVYACRLCCPEKLRGFVEELVVRNFDELQKLLVMYPDFWPEILQKIPAELRDILCLSRLLLEIPALASCSEFKALFPASVLDFNQPSAKPPVMIARLNLFPQQQQRILRERPLNTQHVEILIFMALNSLVSFEELFAAAAPLVVDENALVIDENALRRFMGENTVEETSAVDRRRKMLQVYLFQHQQLMTPQARDFLVNLMLYRFDEFPELAEDLKRQHILSREDEHVARLSEKEQNFLIGFYLRYGSMQEKKWVYEQLVNTDFCDDILLGNLITIFPDKLRELLASFTPNNVFSMVSIIISLCNIDDIEWAFRHYREDIRRFLEASARSPNNSESDNVNQLVALLQNRYYRTKKHASTVVLGIYDQSRYLAVAGADAILDSLGKSASDKKLQYLRVLEIRGEVADTQKLTTALATIKANCPRLQIVLLPTHLLQLGVESGLPCEEIQKTPELVRMLRLGSGEDPTVASTSRPQPAKQRGLFLAQNGSAGMELNPEVKDPVFTLLRGGEILSGGENLEVRIRTGIIHVDTNTLQKSTLGPSNLSAVAMSAIIPLTDEVVRQYKNGSPGHIFAQFNMQLRAGQKTPLLSLSADEEIMAASLTDRNDISFERGADGFYYVTASRDGDFSYIVWAQEQALSLAIIDDLPPEIQGIVDDYKNSSKYAETAVNTRLPDRTGLSTPQWLAKWYEERAGVCEHRCLAVYHKIVTDYPQYMDQVRMVCIDNNHVRLEVKIRSGKWRQVDFGGGAGQIRYAPAGAAYAPAPRDDKVYEARSAGVSVGARSSTAEAAAGKAVVNPAQQRLTAALRDCFALEALPEANSNQELTQLLAGDGASHKRVLIQSGQLQDHLRATLRESVRANINTFCINEPSDIDVDKTQVCLGSEASPPELSETGALQHFLAQAAQRQTPACLLINWSAFTGRQRLALNTLVDEQRTICGIKVPDNVQVIGFTDKLPADSSFIFRHDVAVNATYAPPCPIPTEASAEETLVVDLKGFPNWREELFGAIVCDHNQMSWEQSDFVRMLLAQRANQAGLSPAIRQVVFTNVPPEAFYEIEGMLQRSKAFGYFSYQQLRIPIPEQVSLHVSSYGFDFRQFNDQRHQLYHTVTGEKVAPGIKVLNTHLFDYVLTNQHVDEASGHYVRDLGWLAAAAQKSPAQLPLFITSNLSESQWYCLFNEARNHNVTFQLFLAPDVKLPNSCQLPLRELPATAAGSAAAARSSATPVTRGAEVIVTNNVAEVMTSLRDRLIANPGTTAKPLPLILDVEDYSFQDLIGQIHFGRAGDQFANFSYRQSPVLAELAAGRDVILKGEFSDAVLNALQPLIADGSHYEANGQKIRLTGKFTIIADSAGAANFSWHDPRLCIKPRQRTPENVAVSTQQARPKIIFRERDPGRWPAPPRIPSAARAAAEARGFIRNRMDSLLGVLQGTLEGSDGQYPMVQLIGESGVGKSRLMQELTEQRADTVTVYHEFANLDAWANDNSKMADGRTKKTKILFIDENNIEDKHLTMFAAMTRVDSRGRRELLYQGKRYLLDDSHKIVFARNPHAYGGGRVKQKLFDQVTVPEINYRDFPDSYIYQQLLKPIYLSSGIGVRAKKPVVEAVFRRDCAALLRRYHQRENMTVRELQSWTLSYCARQRLKGSLYQRTPSVTAAGAAASDYVETKSTAAGRVALTLALEVNEQRKSRRLIDEGLGLNGVLIEGKPGLGKSEMVGHVLRLRGYTECTADADPNQKQYCKLDASLSFEAKKAQIIRAFEAGQILWIDEINSCLDDGLEKVLNAVLTGYHPDTKQQARNAGFRLIATANSAGLEGRSVIGRALRHRSVQIRLPKPDAESLHEMLLGVLTHKQKAQVDVQQMAEYLFGLMKKSDAVNLRSIVKKLPRLVEVFANYRLESPPATVVREMFSRNRAAAKADAGAAIAGGGAAASGGSTASPVIPRLDPVIPRLDRGI